MKILFVIAGLAAAAVVGMVLFLSRPSAGPPRSAGAPEVAALDARTAEILSELRALRARQEELAARVEDLELRPVAPAADSARVPERVPVERSFDEEIDERKTLLASLQQPGTAENETFQTVVLDVIAAKEEAERLEREERRRQAAEERLNDRMDRLTRELDLDGYQTKEMRKLLAGADTRRDELFTKLREDGTFDRNAIRDSMREIQTATQQGLEALLTPDQIERYEELDGGRGGWGRRGGDDGGGRGGGRGGRTD